MGLINSKKDLPQVLIVGPEGSGKSLILYREKFERYKKYQNKDDYNKDIEALEKNLLQTNGFQFEEITQKENLQEDKTAGFWDIGGGEISQLIQQQLIQSVKFSAVLVVIDITKEVRSIYGGISLNSKSGIQKNTNYNSQIDIARRQIHQIMSDDSMRYVHTLAIVLNCKRNSELYRKIYPQDPKNGSQPVPDYLSEPIEKIVTIRGSDYITYEENKQQRSTSQAKIKSYVNSNKQESKEKNDIKKEFLQRFLYSKEYLNMFDVLANMHYQTKNEENKFQFMYDVFDVSQDQNQRREMFSNIIRQLHIKS